MNINFLNLLVEKLNVGSMRSIYLSAMPGRYRARMDLSDFDKINPDFSKIFFENLFTKKDFSMKIRMTNEEKNQSVERKIQYLFNENMNILREEGVNSLALGYPILVKQNNKTKSVMKSPLFIWKLDITRSKSDMNEFIISKDENSTAEINKVLLMQLLSDDKTDLSSVYEAGKDEDDSVLTFDEIKNILSEINKKLKIEYSEEFKLEKFPENSEKIDEKGKTTPFIFYGGVLGLFKRQNEGIIQDFNTLAENFSQFKFNVSERDDFQLNKNTSISTDPSQQNVVETLTDSQYKIIQGPPGTGKSQTLTAIITNSLENGANILIVCEKKTALDVIYEKLTDIGLGDLTVMLNDPVKDRRDIVKRVRDLAENLSKAEQFDEAKYEYSVMEYKALKDKYNSHQKFLEGNMKNTNLTVNDVMLNLLGGKEYQDYYHVDTEKNNTDTIYRILDIVDRLLNKIGAIDKIRKFEEIYNDKFKNIQSYEIFFEETSNTLNDTKKMINFIKDNTAKYGKQFEEFFGVNKLKVSIFSIFNSKVKSIKNAWEDIYKNSGKISAYNDKYIDKKFTQHDYGKYEKELEEFSEILNEITDNRNGFMNFIDEKKSGEITREEEAFINNFIKYVDENKIEDRKEFLKLSYYYSLLQNSNVKNEMYKDYSVNMGKLFEYDKFIIDNQKYQIKKNWQENKKKSTRFNGKRSQHKNTV